MSDKSNTDEILTPERKAELLAQAQKNADQVAPPSTEKISPEMSPAPVMGSAPPVVEVAATVTADRPITPPTGGNYKPGSGSDIDPDNFVSPEYGPYDKYEIVMTPWGEFGVPKGHVLSFRAERTFSQREGRFIIAHFPTYRIPERTG